MEYITSVLEIPRPAVTVYGASSSEIRPDYVRAAFEVGRLLALCGRTLVCGGGAEGLMGAVIDGNLSAGGTAVGIIPRFMADRGWGHQGLTSMLVAEDMHSRKSMMARAASAVIALPGGVGTLDELMEIITWRQLGLFKGPVAILNTRGYYQSLFAMLRHAEAQGFMRKGNVFEEQLYEVAPDPARAVNIALSSEI